MAEEPSGDSLAMSVPGRTGPVLVPQAALLGKPDISLSRSVITVGARPSSRIHLVSRTVSQFHAMFVNSSGSVSVCDLASRSGVQVNGKPIKCADLKSGDLVQIGKFLFRFRAPRPEAVAGPPPLAVLDVPGDLPISLDVKSLLIGRRETCDVPLTDDLDVSTLHAVLFQFDGQWVIRDLESRTGTQVNGKRIHQAILNFGNSITIGASNFVFSPAGSVLEEPATEAEPFDSRADIEPATQAPSIEPVASEPQEPSFEPAIPALDLEPPDVSGPVAEADLATEITAASLESSESSGIELEPLEPPALDAEATTPDEMPGTADDLEFTDEVDFGEPTPEPLVTAEPEPVPQSTESQTTAELEPAIDLESPAPANETAPGAEPFAEPQASIEPEAEIDLAPTTEAESDEPTAEALATVEPEPEIDLAPTAEAEPDEPTAESLATVEPEPEIDLAPTAETESDEPTAESLATTEPEHEIDLASTTEAESDEPIIESEPEIDLAPMAEAESEEPTAESLATVESEPEVDLAPTDEAESDEPTAKSTAAVEPEPEIDLAPTTEPESDKRTAESLAAIEPEFDLAPTTETESDEPTAELEPQLDLDPTEAEQSEPALEPDPTAADETEPPLTASQSLPPIENVDPPATDEVAQADTVPEPPVHAHDLASLADDEDFVAIPEIESIEPVELNVTSATAIPTEELLPPVPSEPPATDAGIASETESLGDAGVAAEPAPPTAPSIFGFDFTGASFLGGMPLALEPNITSSGSSDPKVEPPNHASPPPALTSIQPLSQPVPEQPAPMPTAPARAVDLDESFLLSDDDDAPAAPPPPSPVPQSASPQNAAEPPIANATGRSAINTLHDEVAVPPWVSESAAKAPRAGRPSLTTAFDGLASGLGASTGGLNVDVFSQMAPPIRDELFGSRGDNPADVILPAAQPEIPPAAPRRDPPLQIPPAPHAQADRPNATRPQDTDAEPAQPAIDLTDQPPHDRYARLPMLLVVMLLTMLAAGMAIFYFLPPAIAIHGSLTFDNLSNQPVPTQRNFEIGQEQRLESNDVRDATRSILAQKSIAPGFIADDLEYVRTIDNADWNGNQLTLHHTSTDDYAGQARISAMLKALAQKDSDLNDNLARAKRAAADAQQKVQDQQQVISNLRTERQAQVRIADSAPQMEDVAALERNANELDAAWVADKNAVADAQSTLDKLQTADPNTPADPMDDPLAAKLRTNVQQAEVALAVARATARNGNTASPTTAAATPTAPAPDLTILSDHVDKARAALKSRLSVLAAEKTQTPAQRTAARQEVIDAQSVRLNTLKTKEATAAAAAQAAVHKSRDQRALFDAGRMAGIRVEDLIRRQQVADSKLRELSDDQTVDDNAASQVVHVAGPPQIDARPGTDTRPLTAALAGITILLLFGSMIYVSMRPPAPTPMMYPTAAVAAEPIPVFGENRNNRTPGGRRVRQPPTPQPDPAQTTE